MPSALIAPYVREMLDKARTAPTMAEAAYYHRKARIALERTA